MIATASARLAALAYGREGRVARALELSFE